MELPGLNLSDQGPAIWCLSVLAWGLIWRGGQRFTKSPGLKSWMARSETAALIFYSSTSLLVMLLLIELDGAQRGGATP
jgi:hypothetical protein